MFQTLVQVFEGVECVIKDHNQQQGQNKITKICMKQGCTKSQILCKDCKFLHNDHREYLVKITDIEKAFIQFRDANQDNEAKMLLEPINKFVQFARKQLDGIEQNVKILNPFNFLEPLMMRNKKQSYHQLKEQVSELVKLIEFDQFKIKIKQLTPQEINIQINNLINQYQLEIKNFMYQPIIQMKPIQQSSPLNYNIRIIQNLQQQQQNQFRVQTTKINKFYFQQKDCGKFINCVSTNCVRCIQNEKCGVRDAHRAYLNRSLQSYEGASLVFKIISIKDIIGIGIDKAIEVTFPNQSNTKIIYGIYLAQSDGYNINDDHQDFITQKCKDFKMVEGQKYRFTFDPINMQNKQFKLEQVENSANQLTMPMKIDKNKDYGIFVELAGSGSQIEIVNE